MDIDGIMKMIGLKDTGYAHNPAEMRLAIEQYAKAERESMRQACIKACENELLREVYEDCGFPYNGSLIRDVTSEIRAIK